MQLQISSCEQNVVACRSGWSRLSLIARPAPLGEPLGHPFVLSLNPLSPPCCRSHSLSTTCDAMSVFYRMITWPRLLDDRQQKQEVEEGFPLQSAGGHPPVLCHATGRTNVRRGTGSALPHHVGGDLRTVTCRGSGHNKQSSFECIPRSGPRPAGWLLPQ